MSMCGSRVEAGPCGRNDHAAQVVADGSCRSGSDSCGFRGYAPTREYVVESVASIENAHRNMWLDLQILAKTPGALIKMPGS